MKTKLDIEARRREGRDVVKELRKWDSDRPSQKMFIGLMNGRLVDARSYADVNRIVCILEKKLHTHIMQKMTQNL